MPNALEKRWRNGLQELGFNTGHSETPVVPVILGEDRLTFQCWKALFDASVFTNPAVRQAVAPGSSLLRTSVIATHTAEQLDHALEMFWNIGRALHVIS